MHIRKSRLVVRFLVLGLLYFPGRANSTVELSDFISVIKQESVYRYSDEELAELKECMLKRAFFSIEITKETNFTDDFKVESCNKKDKYARYLSPEEAKQFNETRNGKFFGIGVQIKFVDRKGLLIEKILPGGPAEKGGLLQKGDIITAVGDVPDSLKPLKDITYNQAVALIRGEENTYVHISVERGDKTLTFNLARGPVVMGKEVKSKVLKPQIGYLKLKGFEQERTDEDMKNELESLRNQGVRNLIFDLRNNPGGLFDVSLRVLELFVRKSGLRMVEDRRISSSVKYNSKRRGPFADWKIVLLVNENSASASEIVAGVLKGWGNKIIGTKTYGKGCGQTPFFTENGGLFIVTTFKYYFADNSTPDEVGVTPDIVVENDKKTSRSAEEEDDPNPAGDKQLDAAIKYLESGKLN
ncbi:PDZ domain-containing protein [Candidatus Giovannonibacteria bacterium]|nr:PDZ domain-containing protein [Candidatus Giovannonibacteria bacterium]